MKDVIRLNSRDRTKTYLEKLVANNDNSKSYTYILRTDSSYIRTGRLNNGSEFIDPSGGPMIVVGCKLEEANAIVKSIHYVENYGYAITFEQ